MFRRIIPILLMIMSLSACKVKPIMNNSVKVKFTKPNQVVSMSVDTTYDFSKSNFHYYSDIHIVSDTILVLMETITDENSYHFHSYSINSQQYLGPFVQNGRAPGEMISPSVVRTSTSDNYFTVKDNNTASGYRIDVINSVISKHTQVVKSDSFSGTYLDWLPLNDSLKFTLQIDNDDIIYRYILNDSTDYKTVKPYNAGVGYRHITHLSSILASSGNTGKVAEVMLFLPQINIIDSECNNILSIIVDRDSYRWKEFLNQNMSMNTTQYYVSASSCNDYIFAVYKKQPLDKIMTSKTQSYIHIFDWNGNFIYNVKVEENIGNVAFDDYGNYLYCIENSDGRIIRYDFNGLI